MCFVSAEIRTSKVRSMNDILCLSCKSVGSLFIPLLYLCVYFAYLIARFHRVHGNVYKNCEHVGTFFFQMLRWFIFIFSLYAGRLVESNSQTESQSESETESQSSG